jgi:threonine/homoserine/homoserine lactone efflux protein
MEFNLLDAVVKGLLLGLFLAISVGPTLFAVLRYSLNHSYRAGIAFVLGVSLSDIMYVTVANFAASWLEALRAYERPIAFGGSLVLIGMGVVGFFRKYKPRRPSSIPLSISSADYFRIWSSGFLVNTLNPGVIITWLAAVTATVNTSGLYRVVLFGTCLGLILFFDFLKVFLADAIRRRLTLRRIMYLQKTAAVCLMAIGVALLISTTFNIHFNKKEETTKPVLKPAAAAVRAAHPLLSDQQIHVPLQSHV